MTNPQRPASDTQHHRQFTVTHPTEMTCVIAVTCELDMITTPTLDQLITQELECRRALLLLDLAGCDFMGSSGLAVLMRAREHTTDTPTRFALAGLNRTVTRALQAVGLEALFDIYPTTPAALSGLSGGLAGGDVRYAGCLSEDHLTIDTDVSDDISPGTQDSS